MTQSTPAALALLALAAFTPGCSVLRYARLVCIEEPKLYCEPKDDRASLATYRSWADQAWAETGACCPEGCLEGDFAWGFREGFAQYVYAGGDGQPPAAPPRPYWQLDLRTPEGAAAVESWFAGYREGARVARDGGFRRTATLQISASLRDCDACGCPDDDACPGGCEVGGVGPTLPVPEVVPTPAEPTAPEELMIPPAAPEAEPEIVPEPEPPRPLPTLEAAWPTTPPRGVDSPSIFRIVN